MTLPWAVEPDERTSPVAHSKEAVEALPELVADPELVEPELVELEPVDDPDDAAELELAPDEAAELAAEEELAVELAVVLDVALLSLPQAVRDRAAAAVAAATSRNFVRAIVTRILQMKGERDAGRGVGQLAPRAGR